MQPPPSPRISSRFPLSPPHRTSVGRQLTLPEFVDNGWWTRGRDFPTFVFDFGQCVDDCTYSLGEVDAASCFRDLLGIWVTDVRKITQKLETWTCTKREDIKVLQTSVHSLHSLCSNMCIGTNLTRMVRMLENAARALLDADKNAAADEPPRHEDQRVPEELSKFLSALLDRLAVVGKWHDDHIHLFSN